MEMVNVHAAKTRLSQLLARIEAGEQIVIARNGVPVARLVPFVEETDGPRRRFGSERDRVEVVDDAVTLGAADDEAWAEWDEEWDAFLGEGREVR